jgi:hypothetical protein
MREVAHRVSVLTFLLLLTLCTDVVFRFYISTSLWKPIYIYKSTDKPDRAFLIQGSFELVLWTVHLVSRSAPVSPFSTKVSCRN